MAAFALICCVFCGGLEVWSESPLTRVFPDGVRSAEAHDDVRLYAARGEREAFQLCLRAPKGGVGRIGIEAAALDRVIGPPEVRRVGYVDLERSSSRAMLDVSRWPDPLPPFAPFDLADGETAAIWVVYEIPRDAASGVHVGQIAVRPERGRKKIVKVAIEVFDFTLPETLSLRNAFPLDRQALAARYGLRDEDVRSWMPVYDALGRAGLSARLWNGGPLIPIDGDGRADAELFQRHVAYAVARAHMNTIDIGAWHNGLQPFPEPADAERQDPLQFYLHDMAAFLEARGWMDKAFIEPAPVGDRREWRTIRDPFFRAYRNDPRFSRLLTGVLHPYFERYAEIWATPSRAYNPRAQRLLSGGHSLAYRLPDPPVSVSAASCDPQHPADDGYDGCLFTFWMSGQTPEPGQSQSFEVTFDRPVTVSELRIVWRTGFESDDIDLQTSSGGAVIRTGGVEWSPFPSPEPFVQSWAVGTFRKPRTFTWLRLRFGSSVRGGPVGIAEIVPEALQSPEPSEIVEPVAMWFALEPGEFPSLAADVHPVEARLIPWICRGRHLAGFTGPGLDTWPETWRSAPIPGNLWACPGDVSSEEFLFYPGDAGLLPSIRSEALRDGLEDYEYLAAADRATAEGTSVVPEAALLAGRRLFPFPLSRDELNPAAEDILKTRIAIGRALTLGNPVGRD